MKANSHFVAGARHRALYRKSFLYGLKVQSTVLFIPPIQVFEKLKYIFLFVINFKFVKHFEIFFTKRFLSVVRFLV